MLKMMNFNRTVWPRPVDLFEDVGWLSERSWGAHVVRPERRRDSALGAAVLVLLIARAPT